METKRTGVSLRELSPDQIDDVLNQVEGRHPGCAATINSELGQIEVVGLDQLNETERAKRQARLAQRSLDESVTVG